MIQFARAPSRRRPLARVTVLAALVALGACHERDVVRYDGTATSSATHASATIAITVYSRADSFVTGYFAMQPPLVGSGHFFGLRTSDGWRMRSRSERGDTIRWSATPLESTRNGARLGGTYVVLSGAQAGDGGTFELRQTWGRGLELPPDRSSSVSSAALTWEPPIVAAVAAAMIVLFVLLCGWVLAVPPTEAPAAPRTPVARDLAGIGGWMALFLIGQGVVTLAAATQLGGVWESLFGGPWIMAGAVPWMRAVLVAESVGQVLRLAVAPVAIVLTLRRWHGAPRLWFAYLLLLGIYAVCDIAAGASVGDSMTALLGGGALSAQSADAMSKAAVKNLRLLLFAVLWASYWSRSERVRLTFGRRALDDWRAGFGAWPRLRAPDASVGAPGAGESDVVAPAAAES